MKWLKLIEIDVPKFSLRNKKWIKIRDDVSKSRSVVVLLTQN